MIVTRKGSILTIDLNFGQHLMCSVYIQMCREFVKSLDKNGIMTYFAYSKYDGLGESQYYPSLQMFLVSQLCFGWKNTPNLPFLRNVRVLLKRPQ